MSIIKYYKGDNTFENIRYLTKCDNNGITALNLVNASMKLGFEVRALKCDINDLGQLKLPVICHVTINSSYNHYIIVEKIYKDKIYVFDPAFGKRKYTKKEFNSIWNNIVIELLPYRKLDVIKSKINLIKRIISNNLLSYTFITIISFVSILLTIINNYYFKSLIDRKNLIFVLLFFLVIIVIKEIVDYIKNLFIINLESNVDECLMIDTNKKLLSLPYYYFNSRACGDITSKIYDLEYVKDLCIKGPIILFTDFILLVISSFLLININKNLFFIFILLCFLYMLVEILFNNKIKDMIKTNQENNAINNQILVENINSINTIKNLNIEKTRINKYNFSYKRYLKHKKIYEFTYNIENFIKNIILFIGLNIILYIGIINVDNNLMKLSDLILFNSLILYFIEPLKSLCELNPLLKNGINALRRIEEIYLIKEKQTLNKKISKCNIKIKNLSYSYDSYNYIFKNFSFDINESDKLVVVGASGSGKSTLFKLINKTYEVSDNMIFIDNYDINEIDMSKYVSYISQEESLFNDTIYNNLVLDRVVCEDELNRVIEITKLDEILGNRNINLDSIIEEDGINFSKGEKQRIILARAILRNNNILILDEALNGVEEDVEYEILSNILKEYKEYTIIYVTHRLKVVKLFKKILDINKLRRENERIK